MIMRFAAALTCFLVLAPAAHAGSLGLAEVRSSDGTLLAEAANGSFSYPADGSVLRVGSAHADATGVELGDVSIFNGRVVISRLLVPARGLSGARVEGLVVDGKAYVVGPNALIRLRGGSFVVALQEAVSPGRHGSGLVGIRAYVSDPSLGLAPGTQILVGLARAARPTGITHAAAILGLAQLPAAQASLAGVPTTFLAGTTASGGIGEQAVALAERFLGVPYVWGGATPAGFDCSGLTMYVYGLLGVRLLHYTGYQLYEGTRVARDQLQPGDLVFFHPGPSGVPGHEGMYIGRGEFIHAPHTGDVVKISSIYDTAYALSYVGAVRPSSMSTPALVAPWFQSPG
jgi:cell wall-associated NlpC family hydrolase